MATIKQLQGIADEFIKLARENTNKEAVQNNLGVVQSFSREYLANAKERFREGETFSQFVRTNWQSQIGFSCPGPILAVADEIERDWKQYVYTQDGLRPNIEDTEQAETL